MPPEKHALLSASSASRWLKCTAAPRFEEHLPERTSEYAEEGRLAHAICELKTLKKFTVMTSRTYTTRLNKLKKDPLYSEEMDKTSDLYIEHLIEQAMLYDSTPTVVAEVQVDFGEYVPEGFGTCDNVMIGGDTLSITDYKHGKGVPVSAVGNPQMRLYALGALKRYMPPSSARASRPWMMSPPTCVTLLPSCWRRAPMRELRLRLALFLLRKEVQDMAVVYATLIIKGRKTIDQVPALLRKQVEEILADLEVEV